VHRAYPTENPTAAGNRETRIEAQTPDWVPKDEIEIRSNPSVTAAIVRPTLKRAIVTVWNPVTTSLSSGPSNVVGLTVKFYLGTL
jgi:hypothetical protein